MEESEIWSALLRGTHLAALASLFGTLLFRAIIIPPLPATAWAQTLLVRLVRLGRISLLLSLILGVAWFIVRAAAIAGASTLPETLAALTPVAVDTRFGRLLLLRLVLLLALTAFCGTLAGPANRAAPRLIKPDARRPPRSPSIAARGWALPTAIALAGAALALQAATSHAGAMEGLIGWAVMAAETLHVLAAGAWLGALAPLLICLSTMPAQPMARVLRQFFPLGLVTVLVIAATSLVQGAYLVGSIAALFGTAFGLVALAKLALFVALLACAALNRLLFGARTGPPLRRSITAEAALAGLTMLAAATLAHLTPATHEQPVWRFAWRLSTAPTGPLFLPAYPSSFFVSPTGFAADAIIRGEQLYQAHCASCHGATAQGNGAASRSLPVPPPDLTTDRVRGYTDGELYWLAGHDGTASAAQRWDLVDYLRAHATGEFVRTSGRGRINLRVPKFTAICADGRDLEADDLRGKVLRILVPPAAHALVTSPEADKDLVTIRLPASAADRPEATACLAQPDLAPALSILMGAPADALAGNELLIDGNSWLRARWRPGQRGGWATPDLLLTRVQVLAERPLPADPTAGHVHH